MSDIRIATAEDQVLLDKEAKYCSYGDTVHYIEPPRIFSRCEGSYVWDTEDQAYLDLQMWYSAVNFGYANPRLNNALKKQIDTLPQIASQYLHKGKIELSEMIGGRCQEQVRPRRPCALQRRRFAVHRRFPEGGAQRQQR